MELAVCTWMGQLEKQKESFHLIQGINAQWTSQRPPLSSGWRGRDGLEARGASRRAADPGVCSSLQLIQPQTLGKSEREILKVQVGSTTELCLCALNCQNQ